MKQDGSRLTLMGPQVQLNFANAAATVDPKAQRIVISLE
jgi:hypothetical protein